MTTISMPTYPNFTNCRFGLESNSQIFTSPLTKTTQRVALGGARWNATYSLPAMNRAQAAPWKAFFDATQGMTIPFNAYDPDNINPRGTPTGTPLVAGGSQTGISLVVDGFTASTLVLKTGDYFSVNGELKRVYTDTFSDGTGAASISFWPPLRNSPADNAPLTVTKATCTMVLADDMQAMFTCDKNGIYQPMTFAAFEVFS